MLIFPSTKRISYIGNLKIVFLPFNINRYFQFIIGNKVQTFYSLWIRFKTTQTIRIDLERPQSLRLIPSEHFFFILTNVLPATSP